jgi:hypothetical protein
VAKHIDALKAGTPPADTPTGWCNILWNHKAMFVRVVLVEYPPQFVQLKSQIL